MAKKDMPPIYQAIEAFYVGGVLINRGDTVVKGHPMLKGRTKLFQLFEPTYGSDDEPDPEPEKPAEEQ